MTKHAQAPSHTDHYTRAKFQVNKGNQHVSGLNLEAQSKSIVSDTVKIIICSISDT